MTKKILTTKFFNVSMDKWEHIKPEQYNHENHKGLITCPMQECNGAMKYVSEYSKDASNKDIDAYFSHNYHGESHLPSCHLNPDPTHQNIREMADALSKGEFVLININFSTSFIRDAGKLKGALARKEMAAINGSYRPDWMGTDEEDLHPFSPFGARSLKKLGAHVAEFKKASKEVLGRTDMSRIVFSYLHGVFPWASFHAKDARSGTISINKQELTTPDIFNVLYTSLTEDNSNKKSFWRQSAPALRVVNPLKAYGNEVWTKEKNETNVNGKDFSLRDVLAVNDEALRDKIMNAKMVTLIATPFITKRNVEFIESKQKGNMCLYWPISSDQQVILE